jgi:DNA-binding transcriptional regulator YiaG
LAQEPESDRVEINMTLSPEICRASRAWLEWTQQELARNAEVAVNTIREFEAKRRELNVHSQRSILFVFANAGLQFLWVGKRPVGILKR